MNLSIVIVNYKSRGLLKQCLRGIADAHLGSDVETIVVENCAGDGCDQMIRQLYPDVRIVMAEKNNGFGAGNNLGFAQATGQYVLVLTPDVAVFPGTVEALMAYLDQHPKAGIVGPRLINPDGSTQVSAYMFPSFLMAIFRRTPLGKLPAGRKMLRQYLMSDWDHNDTRPVGWVLGACFLARREVLQAIHGFDERYFLYVEDTDLCRRCWAAGWEVHYLHLAEMVHYHQRESAANPGLSGIFSYPTRVHIQSWLHYFAKYRGQPRPPHSL